MIAVTVADVFLRYVFNSPIRVVLRLVETMLLVFVFNGMSTAFLQRRNIVIDLIDSFAPRAVVTLLIRVADLLTVVTLCIFAYAMITPALQAYQLRRPQARAAAADLDPVGSSRWPEWPARSSARSARCSCGGARRHDEPARMSPSTIGAIGVLVAVRDAAAARAGVDRADAGRLHRQHRHVGLARRRSRSPARCRSTSARPIRCRCVPLFILMGEVASVTGLSADLFKAARIILAGMRGGLAVGDAGAPPPASARCAAPRSRPPRP